MKTSKPYLILVFIFILGSCTNKKTDSPVKSTNPDTIIDPVTMELRSRTIPLNIDYIEGTFFNNMNQEATFGEDFQIEILQDSIWKYMIPSGSVMINSLAYIVRANGWCNFRHSLYQDLYNYRPGRYRISNTLMYTFETEFYVNENPQTDRNDSVSVGEERLFFMHMLKNPIPVSADTIFFNFTNNSNVDVYPLEHHFLMHYDEKAETWMDISYSQYISDTRKLSPGESTEFYFPLDSKWQRRNRINLYKGKYFLSPGKYKIRKYMHIPSSCEFELSEDKIIAKDYHRIEKEYPLKNDAEYIGGDSLMNAFLKQEMKLPVPQSQLNRFSFAHVKLDIDSFGNTSNPRIFQISDSVMIDETMRLTNLLKAWEPARNVRGKSPITKIIFIKYKDD